MPILLWNSDGMHTYVVSKPHCIRSNKIPIDVIENPFTSFNRLYSIPPRTSCIFILINVKPQIQLTSWCCTLNVEYSFIDASGEQAKFLSRTSFLIGYDKNVILQQLLRHLGLKQLCFLVATQPIVFSSFLQIYKSCTHQRGVRKGEYPVRVPPHYSRRVLNDT